MKKAWIPWAIIAALGIVIAFMGGYLLADGKSPASANALTADTIDESAAKAIALAHANVSENDVNLLHVKQEQDDGRPVYDVDFVKDGAEYEYKINAADGAVLSYDCDAKQATGSPAGAASSTPSSATDAAPSSTQSSSQSAAQAANNIGEDAAKAAAFTHAGVAEKDASFIQISFKSRDGHAKYDIEFRKGFTEYDYEIDASTGKVLQYEVDSN